MLASRRLSTGTSRKSHRELPEDAFSKFDFDYDATNDAASTWGLQQGIKWLHRQANYYMTESIYGLYWDLMQVVLAFLSIVMYVYEMYAYITPDEPLEAWAFGMEVAFAVIFFLDLALALLAAERKLQYITSREFVLDTLSLLPILTLVTLASGEPGASLAFLRTVRLFRCVRVMEAAAGGYHRRSNSPDASVQRQIMILVANVCTYVMFCSGLVHSVERTWPGTFYWPQQATDGDCDFAVLINVSPSERPASCTFDIFFGLYFTLITTLTVGFGDVYPLTHLGRVIVLAILLPMFIIVPSEASRLVALVATVSKYVKGFPGSAHGHVVLCGNITGPGVYSFLSQWYHPDHGDQKMRVVVLHPAEPDQSTKAALDDPKFDQRVQYVKGSPLSNQDLAKAAIYDSQAIFVMSVSQNQQDTSICDAAALLTVRILKTTCPWVPIHLQLISPSSTIHTWAEWDLLVCAQELKNALFAKSIVCPGFGTFVSNLVTSSSNSSAMSAVMMQGDESDRRWMKEYLQGSGHELYTLTFSPCFSKQFFNVAAHIAFSLWGITLIGVETQRSRKLNTVDEIFADTSASAADRARRLADHRAKLIGLVVCAHLWMRQVRPSVYASYSIYR
jgi:hypothetical protein